MCIEQTLVLLVKYLTIILIISSFPSIPWIREKMFDWSQMGKGKRNKIGKWYEYNWQTILSWTYIAVFVLPFMLGFWQYRFELLKDVASSCSLIVVGFTIIIFLHFQLPLVTKPRIYAVAIPPKELDDGRYIPDDSRMGEKIEVSAKEASLIFVRITNLGVNTYKNSGIIVDFSGITIDSQRMVEVIPPSDALYNKIPWKANFRIFKHDYIIFPPTLSYQTIAVRSHLLLPIWIKTKSSCEGQISVLFHCETRNGETDKKLNLIVK